MLKLFKDLSTEDLSNENPHKKCDKSEFFLMIKLSLIESVGWDLTYRKQETVNTGGLLKIWVKIFFIPKNDADLI